MLCFALNAFAQTTAADSVYVVKNGIIVGSYQVGTDVDNIKFEKKETPKPQTGNYVKIGDKQIALNSVVVTTAKTDADYTYVYMCEEEGVKTAEEMAEHSFVLVVMTDDLLGQDIKLSEFDDDSDSFFQAYYMPDNDDEDPVGGSAWDWSDCYSDGTLKVDVADGNVSVALAWAGADEYEDFAVSFTGTYGSDSKSGSMKIGDTSVDLNSVVVKEDSEYTYLYLSEDKNANTVDAITENPYVLIAMTPDLLGTDIKLSEFDDDSDSFFQVYYMKGEDDYVGATAWDWSDCYSDGTLKVDVADGNVNVKMAWVGAEGYDNFDIDFEGTYAAPKESTYKIGDNTTKINSAVVQEKGGSTYVYMCEAAGVKTLADMADESYVVVSVTDDLLGTDIKLSEFDDDSDSYFQAYYISTNEDEDMVGGSAWDWSDCYSDGTLKIVKTDDNVIVTMAWAGADDNPSFEIDFDGAYTMEQDATYYFNVDGNKSKLYAAFAEERTDGVSLYLTSGDITDAKRLEDCHYYARVFVPTASLDGTQIDITGDSEYEFDFFDNYQQEKVKISNGNCANASGSFYVKKNDDGTYEVKIDVEGLGDNKRSLAAYYVGEPMVYDTSVPNQVKLQNGDAVALNSAVAKLADGLYTIWISSKEGVTTEEGMADAEIVITIPESFATNEIKGFSGTEDNAKISITYDGATYNQASCAGTDANALGGNIRVNFVDGTVDTDFNVYNIYKYSNANLNGHFSGSVTILE